MEGLIYQIILAYFVIGAIAFALVSRNKTTKEKKETWIKFGTYFVIIQILYGSIYFGHPFFSLVGILIAAAGYIELYNTARKNKKQQHARFLGISLGCYTLLAIPFLFFTFLDQPLLFFTVIVVAVFDAFSQISGQLLGGRKLIPSVSPRKTISGVAGGSAIAIITAILTRELTGGGWDTALFFGAIIIIFALSGDLLASYFKRQYKVKDFGQSLPGHGGFLDRFDSLLPGGAAVFVLNIFLS